MGIGRCLNCSQPATYIRPGRLLSIRGNYKRLQFCSPECERAWRERRAELAATREAHDPFSRLHR